MSRRKKSSLLLVREPNGRLSRSNPLAVKACAPAEVRRIRDAAIAGVYAPEFGTQLGRLFLTGKISAPHFEAGKRWALLASEYYSAIDTSGPNVAALVYEKRGHGHPPDPDSDLGKTIARADLATVQAMHEAHAALLGAGKSAESAVRATCERDEAPVGEYGLNSLDRGLGWLAAYMGLTPAPKHVRRSG